MKWFDTWIIDKAHKVLSQRKQADESLHYKMREEKYAVGQALNNAGAVLSKGSSIRELESHPDLNFRMYRAENGYVMEVRQMDRRTDRHSINMHLITDEEDLGQRIAQIITIESLKVQ